MNQILRFLTIAALTSVTGSVYAQGTQDAAPTTFESGVTNYTNKAIFDVDFNIDIGATGSVGANGLAGVAFVNNTYWVSQWATDTLRELSPTGTLMSTFTIPGVTGTRSITYDGTDIYIGAAGLSIYKIDPATKTLSSTISITTTSNAAARMCTYDANLDGGNGGFWIGNFGSDIASVSMTGAELSVIPAATHATTIYGGAIDNTTTAGSFLWIHDQNGSGDLLTQLNTTDGAQTGLSFDYATAAPSTTTAVLGGGLFITDQVNSSFPTFIGISQATPSNILFSLELTQPLSVTPETTVSFDVYPNPAINVVNVTSNFNGNQTVEIFDITGKTVLVSTLNNGADINVSELTKGAYFVKVSQNGNSATKKLIIK